MAVQPTALHSFIHYAVAELASKPRGRISQVSGKRSSERLRDESKSNRLDTSYEHLWKTQTCVAMKKVGIADFYY
jgi:hypothetical protein